MDVDANLYQDVTEIVDVDPDVDVWLIQVVVSVETTAVYGSFFFSFSVEDAVAILLAVMDAADVAAMTAVSGSSFYSFSAVAVVTIHGVITAVVTMVADATTVAANKINFEDGSGRPFCMLYYFSYHISS